MSHRERHRIVAVRQIQSADDHLMRLQRRRAVGQLHLRANGLRVRGDAFETHLDARRRGVVAHHECRRAEAIDNDVQVAIAVKIGDGDAVRDVSLDTKTPHRADVLERHVAAIAKRDVLERERRELPFDFLPGHVVQSILQPLLHVGIHDVPQMSVGDQDVLPAVEIDVHEDRAPRPATRLHTGGRGHFGEGAVTTIEKKRIALLLQGQLHLARMLRQRRVRRNLRFFAPRIICHHIRLKQIRSTIAVHVGDVDAHRRTARGALRHPVREAEISEAIVEPDLIEIFEVVRDVQIWRPIAIQIDELGRQTERLELLRDGFACRITKARRRHRDAREMPGPVVDVELIRLGALRHAQPAHVRTDHELVVTAMFRQNLVLLRTDLAHHLVESALLRRNRVVDAVRFVVRDVHRQPPAAVDVRHGDGRGPATDGVEPEIAPLGESPVAVVQEDRIRARGRQQNQIEVAIAIDVCKRRTGRVAITRTHSRARRDVFELPVPQIAIEGATPFGAREKDVWLTIAVDIAQRHPATLTKHAVSAEDLLTRDILKTNTGCARVHTRESRRAEGHLHVAPPIAVFVVPRRRDGAVACGEQCEDADCKQRRRRQRRATHGRAVTVLRRNAVATCAPMQRPSTPPTSLPVG